MITVAVLEPSSDLCVSGSHVGLLLSVEEANPKCTWLGLPDRNGLAFRARALAAKRLSPLSSLTTCVFSSLLHQHVRQSFRKTSGTYISLTRPTTRFTEDPRDVRLLSNDSALSFPYRLHLSRFRKVASLSSFASSDWIFLNACLALQVY